MQVKVIVVPIVKFASRKYQVLLIILESSIYLLSRYSLKKLVMVGWPLFSTGHTPHHKLKPPYCLFHYQTITGGYSTLT